MSGALNFLITNSSRNEVKPENPAPVLDKVSASLAYPTTIHEIKHIDLTTEDIKAEFVKKNDTNSFEVTISRQGDVVRFMGFTIDSNTTHTPSHIKDVEIMFSNQTYIKIPYNILFALADVKHNGTKTNVKIDCRMFIREIILLRMAFIELKVRVNCVDSSNIKSITLHCEFSYRNAKVRSQLTQAKSSETVIQTFDTIGPTKAEDDITFTAPVRPKSGFLKGVVIEYPVEEIENVQMRIGNYDRYNYDKDDLFFNSQKLTDNLLFIPFANSASLSSTEQPTTAELLSMHALSYNEFYSSNTGIAQIKKRRQFCPDYIAAGENIPYMSNEDIEKIIREGNEDVGKRFTPILTVKTASSSTEKMLIHAVNINVYELKSGCASFVDFFKD
jgi:hypothetical protein